MFLLKQKNCILIYTTNNYKKVKSLYTADNIINTNNSSQKLREIETSKTC